MTRTHALESLGDLGLGAGPVGPRHRGGPWPRCWAALSRSSVSRICSAIRDEFAAWCARRLDDIVLDYLFLDASNFRMHPNAPAEPVLAAWGITTGGKPVFIGLAPAGSESTDAWADPRRAHRSGATPAAAGHL